VTAPAAQAIAVQVAKALVPVLEGALIAEGLPPSLSDEQAAAQAKVSYPLGF
jgi:hypothetical protein